MPTDRKEIGSSEDWLKRAKSNLIRARQPKPDEVFWEDYCFDAQQAVEKALKMWWHGSKKLSYQDRRRIKPKSSHKL
jgi:hypothetical protein